MVVLAAHPSLGPRFTLRLRSLQLGTFDTQHGEYEWRHKAQLDTYKKNKGIEMQQEFEGDMQALDIASMRRDSLGATVDESTVDVE